MFSKRRKLFKYENKVCRFVIRELLNLLENSCSCNWNRLLRLIIKLWTTVTTIESDSRAKITRRIKAYLYDDRYKITTSRILISRIIIRSRGANWTKILATHIRFVYRIAREDITSSVYDKTCLSISRDYSGPCVVS